MYEVINPKIRVVGFGPSIHLENGEITPDELVYGASKITYKGLNALEELIQAREGDANVREQMTKSIINSAGSGHASMSTSMGLWTILEGVCSKFVDSIFTGAVFSSSLMPSGRRVPIAKENIVIPKGIAEKGKEAIDIYVKASENNIDVYEAVQKAGVSTQESSKIVQYGHFGGGFMFMPLETLISYSKMFKKDPDSIPLEGHEILSQLEKFIHENGMGVVYESRKAAPREGCPNPNIFHKRNNLAGECAEEIKGSPKIISVKDLASYERGERVSGYLKFKEDIFSNQDRVYSNWKEVLGKLQDIVEDFNSSIEVTTFANSPWRVWGEVKRHRTLSQIAESIYHAIDRASNTPKENFDSVLSIPEKIRNNKDNLKMWENAFADSLDAYNQLMVMGVKESDAIAVIPRGVKLGIIKNFDLYNLTTGYMSLRTCSTAEPEMRETTEKEMKLILEKKKINSSIKSLIGPKCYETGFCHESNYKRCCGKVQKCLGFKYDENFHNKIAEAREQEIRKAINE